MKDTDTWGPVRGLINFASPHDTATTANRLDKVLQANGMNVIARVDHAQAAAGAAMGLRPTELLIFGNPQAGTPLMQSSQTAAIDLPQKALIWEDVQNQVWISFNDPNYLMTRHGIEDNAELAEKMKSMLAAFATEVSRAT